MLKDPESHSRAVSEQEYLRLLDLLTERIRPLRNHIPCRELLDGNQRLYIRPIEASLVALMGLLTAAAVAYPETARVGYTPSEALQRRREGEMVPDRPSTVADVEKWAREIHEAKEIRQIEIILRRVIDKAREDRKRRSAHPSDDALREWAHEIFDAAWFGNVKQILARIWKTAQDLALD